MFPVTDGMQIVSEYVRGHMPASEIIEKYHLSTLCRLFGYSRQSYQTEAVNIVVTLMYLS